MKLKRLASVLWIAAGLVVGAWLSLAHIQVSLAQEPIILSKVLNRPSNVVRVGEVLTFTIALTNNSGFTITQVALIDTYDNSTLAFQGASLPISDHDAATGVITWGNVVGAGLSDGQAITLTVAFTAEHPKTAVVNAVRAQDIISGGVALSNTVETSRTQEAIGGRAPVVKSLYPPGSVPQIGLSLTFTHIISNDGAATMIQLPVLTDTYDPAFLQFNFAVPTPTLVTPGLLVWTDLTTRFGSIPPFGTVVVTTVFTATTQVISTSNSASVQGALDEFNNDLTAGAAQVPITIIGEESPAPTPEHSDRTPAPTPTPAPTLAPTATPVITTTSQYPVYLPETGRAGDDWPAVITGLLLFVLGGYLLKRFKKWPIQRR